VATRTWHRGEVVNSLQGVVANEKTNEDRNVIIPGVNDFSVTISTRTKENQLWLGPAAYINHDCNANTKLRATGTTKNSTAVYEVTRMTESGEELLINYGNNFFGSNNANCQCRTCERRFRGAFTQKPNSSRSRTTSGKSDQHTPPKSSKEDDLLLITANTLSPSFSVQIGGYPMRQNSRAIRESSNLLPKPQIKDQKSELSIRNHTIEAKSIGKTSIGKTSIGKTSIGKTSIGKSIKSESTTPALRLKNSSCRGH